VAPLVSKNTSSLLPVDENLVAPLVSKNTSSLLPVDENLVAPLVSKNTSSLLVDEHSHPSVPSGLKEHVSGAE